MVAKYQYMMQENEKEANSMPKVGDKEFPYTPEGKAAAQAESQDKGIPISNGAQRNVQSYAGGGKTGYAKIGSYKEGGEVKKTGKKNDPADKGIKEYYEKKAKERGPADLPLVMSLGDSRTEEELRAIMADEHPYIKGSDLYKHEVWSVDQPAPEYNPNRRSKKKKKKK
jgi:hypothetical protein